MDSERLIIEIDKMHHLANEALRQKRFDIYINCFTDNLSYKQMNGKVIDKKELSKNIAFYFNRLKTSKSQYERMNYSIDGNRITENLIQKATASIRIFIFFTKTWTVDREGIYEWVKMDEDWKIEKVEILNEKIY